MLGLLIAIVGALRAAFRPRASLVAENLALRQQLAVLRQKTKRPRLSPVERRLILHVNVTAHPYAEWAAKQIVEADGAYKLIIRDRDGIFGAAFDRRVENLGIRQLRIATRSPWQNGYAERLVATFRRDLTDHLIVFNERHLLRAVRECANFYNSDRPHMSLDGDAPRERNVEPPETGRVVALRRVSGLHHRYVRRAA